MLNHWSSLLTTDCNVIKVKNFIIYPIFRSGWTSLTSVASKTYTNKEIAMFDNINVLIRDPKDRFISGVNYYCQTNNLDVKKTWLLISKKKLINCFGKYIFLTKIVKSKLNLIDHNGAKRIAKHILNYDSTKVKN